MGTILLVEDELEMARVVRRELQANGYRVIHAADGVAALDLNDREDPDLVILDWMLPTLDGLEVLRRIRQRSTVPILMLTARGEEVDRVIGLEVGADDYLHACALSSGASRTSRRSWSRTAERQGMQCSMARCSWTRRRIRPLGLARRSH